MRQSGVFGRSRKCFARLPERLPRRAFKKPRIVAPEDGVSKNGHGASRPRPASLPAAAIRGSVDAEGRLTTS